jgi:hypothetical protein
MSVFSTAVILNPSFDPFLYWSGQTILFLSLFTKSQSVRWLSDFDRYQSFISVYAKPLTVHDAALFVATFPALLTATRGLAYPAAITLLLLLLMIQLVSQVKLQLLGKS